MYSVIIPCQSIPSSIVVNMILKVNHGVLFSNGGWDLKMKNNIIIEPLSNSFVISAQFYSWAKNQAAEYFGKNGILRKRLTESIKFDQPPYSTRYPSLLPYLDVIVEGKEWQGMRSRGNEFSSNVIIGGPEQLVKLMGGEFATAYENNYTEQYCLDYLGLFQYTKGRYHQN